jgi:hypothetical protein
MIDTNLSSKALLVELKIGNWSGRRYDPSASLSVSETFNNDPEYARVNKALVAKDAIQKIYQIVYAVRRYHYSMTLPWGDSGARLLPGELYLEYSKKIGEFKRKFISRVEEFLSSYPELMKEARHTLNGLFKPDDYHSLRGLRNKFCFELHFTPISEIDDLRINLQKADKEKLKREIEYRQNQLQEEAMTNLWQRLYELVKPMADKLNDPKGIFRDSLVEKIHDLVNLLPKLNISGDQHLTDLTNEIRQKLCTHSPAELRDLDGVRGQVAKDADDILDKMKGYTGGEKK